MKLNQDCVRDLLLAIETHGTMDPLFHDQILELPELRKYHKDTVVYTAHRLDEAGFINGNFDYSFDDEYHIIISSLTYQGHLFLDTVRDEGIWNETKKAASKVSGVSLPVLMELGTSFVKSKLGLS